MAEKKRYEILESLPVYGPMYIPVTENGEPYYSEGFAVRFYKTDGTNWVANFKPGWTGLNKVFDFPEHDKTIIIAGGLGYIMTPENEKPLSTFGDRISWDGIQNLKFKNNIISGQSYEPSISMEGWTDFSLNIETKELIGGSYKELTVVNPYVQNIVLQNESKSKSWWKIW